MPGCPCHRKLIQWRLLKGEGGLFVSQVGDAPFPHERMLGPAPPSLDTGLAVSSLHTPTYFPNLPSQWGLREYL